MATPPAFAPAPDESSSADTRRSLFIVALLTAAVAVPVGVSVGMKWVDMPWAEPARTQAAPDWVALPTVRATTSDGTVRFHPRAYGAEAAEYRFEVDGRSATAAPGASRISRDLLQTTPKLASTWRI